ncbi:MAG: Hpt domain-containing protein [Solirubrobacterales bacterium]
MAELAERFRAEAQDRSAQIELLLASLPAAADPAMICDEIRDHAHKIKGAAGMFGFDELRARASELEEEASAQSGAADGGVAAAELAPVFAELTAAIPAE